MRQALAVASECAPLVKTGGLADVVGALPAVMAGQGWRLRTLLPGYPAVLAALGAGRTMLEDAALFGGPARVLAGQAAGLDVLVLDAPHLYVRAGSPYLDPQGRDWGDNPERFAALSWVAAAIGAGRMADWRPEVLHLHDWQAGFAPVYLAGMGGGAGSVLTIHNIAFHGLAPAAKLAALRLPAEGFTPEGFEYYGHVGALKAGLVGATRLSTVSPTYARELTTPEFGMGLDGVIRSRAGDLSGILNGIDTAVWDPAADPLVWPFRDARGKAANRARLLAEFGLEPGAGPVCIVVSRLSAQKGLDVLLDAVPALVARGGRLLLLGSGDRALENAWLRAAEGSASIAVRIGYDEALSHRMFAGGDAVLVPSRFEPCGLTQMYGLRYGAVPLVARTGGLADTVIDANDAALKAGVATGLQVAPLDAATLAGALGRLCDLHADRRVWARLVKNAMHHPVGWETSAPQYAALYAAAATA
jgi:starch synthase